MRVAGTILVIIASGIGRAGFRARRQLLRRRQPVQPAIDGPGPVWIHLAGAAAFAIPSDISWRLAAAELRAAELRRTESRAAASGPVLADPARANAARANAAGNAGRLPASQLGSQSGPFQTGQTGQRPSAPVSSATQGQIRSSLEASGFKNVTVLPQSYLIRATAPDGSQVVMQVSSDGVYGVVVNSTDQASSSGTGGSTSTGGTSSSTGSASASTGGTSGTASGTGGTSSGTGSASTGGASGTSPAPAAPAAAAPEVSAPADTSGAGSTSGGTSSPAPAAPAKPAAPGTGSSSSTGGASSTGTTGTSGKNSGKGQTTTR